MVLVVCLTGPPRFTYRCCRRYDARSSNAAIPDPPTLRIFVCMNTSNSNASPLSGKICLVTGATRGIGRAITMMLLQEGALVAICGRTQGSVDEAVAALAAENPGKVKGKAADVRKHEQVGELFRFIDAEFGGLDVLVNNAGVGVF